MFKEEKMAEEVRMFKSFDGRVFDSEKDCLNHELWKKDKIKIKEFLASPANFYDKPAHIKVAEKTLVAFTEYLRDEKEAQTMKESVKGEKATPASGKPVEESAQSEETKPVAEKKKK